MSSSTSFNIIKKFPRFIKFNHSTNVNFTKKNEVINNPYLKYIQTLDNEIKDQFKNNIRSKETTLYLRTLQRYYIEHYQKNKF